MDDQTEARASRPRGDSITRWREIAHDNHLLNLDEIRMGRDELESAPVQLMVDLIGVCNMRPHCRMCVLDENNPSVHPGLEKNAFDYCHRLLDRCSYVTDCSVGEVLLHPHLFGFLDLIHSKGKRIGLTSNAIALTREMTDRLLPYTDSLYMLFSVDASSPETYNFIRGPYFDEVRSNIARFCRSRHDLGESLSTDVGVCFIPMRCNRREIPGVFDLARELGVDYVLFTSLYSRPVNKIVEHDGLVFDYYRESLSFDELEECRDVALESSSRTGVEFRCQYNKTEEQISEEFKPAALADIDAPCVMPWRYAKLVQNGETHPCLYIPQNMGNWKQEPFESIWNCADWRRIRAELASGRLAEPCLSASSCPIVRSYRANHPEAAADEGLLFRARTSNGYDFVVSDRDFESLIGTDIYAVEVNPEDGEAYRWLGQSASLELPNPWPGEAYEIRIHCQTHKPDIAQAPIFVSVTVDGEAAGGQQIDDSRRTVIGCRFSGASTRLALGIGSTGCWRPADYSVDHSSDRRLLSVRVSKITIARVSPVSS